MINDHISAINGRLLRPLILAIEPALVPPSQAFGSPRRGATLAAHCSWALFMAATHNSTSAGPLFTDMRSAYYTVIRQFVVGSKDTDEVVRAILQKDTTVSRCSKGTGQFY